ncbi:hypothetical protein [Photobacterium sp. OFAV2-7]|uniref:hypothetical protein n=1 Tax=Photobacterium sp. OFAV2-7 TaxID=2917748 RepID=UPI001EF732B0|nr:hypothetical protein [Photobacterium sp. OFAV2-7]MCG7586813.1 hypothetical protein [Photobacterium sp. OFAV2-7]
MYIKWQKNMQKFIIVFTMILFTNSSFAVEGWGLYPTATVSQIVVEDGLYAVKFDGWPNHTCGTGEWRAIFFSDPGAKEKYSLLLSALMANKKVNIYVQNCVAGYEKIRSVAVIRE